MGYAIVHAGNYFKMTCPEPMGDVLSVVFIAPCSEGRWAVCRHCGLPWVDPERARRWTEADAELCL